MIVCKTCLMEIESHEGNQIHKSVSYDDDVPRNEDGEIQCEWCEEWFDYSDMEII